MKRISSADEHKEHPNTTTPTPTPTTMDVLMTSVSGVRGVAGRSLTPRVVESYVSAFCHLQNQQIKTKKTDAQPAQQQRPSMILGRDSRVSGPWVTKIVEGVLIAMGFRVFDLGIVPTPTVQYMVIKEKAVGGGIIVTSSHNPVEWNGLKFVENNGLFISPDKCTELFKIAERVSVTWPSWEEIGVSEDHSAVGFDAHVDAILSLPHINTSTVKERKFKVCLDTVNGAGGPIMKSLLEKLGCTVIPINVEPNGRFSHSPEPVPENLSQLCRAVKENNAHFGIATDPDVDRCVFIDETGNPIGEEYTLALAVQFWLGKCGKRGPICKNLSSSRALDDIAKAYDCPVYSTPVGEIHVANKMIEVGAVIGGEGNGGVMLPEVHIGRDAPVAAALVLQLLSTFNGTLSDLKKSLPQWFIVKKKASVVGINPDEIISSILNEWKTKGAEINTSDGVRIETTDWWVHVRKSNTEPIVRVIGEARTEEQANEVVDQFAKKIEKNN